MDGNCFDVTFNLLLMQLISVMCRKTFSKKNSRPHIQFQKTTVFNFLLTNMLSIVYTPKGTIIALSSLFTQKVKKEETYF